MPGGRAMGSYGIARRGNPSQGPLGGPNPLKGLEIGPHSGPYKENAIHAIRYQTTSEARLTIFMNRLSRSSRAMAPKIRVPRGSLSLLIRTQALRSKRT